MSEPYQPEPVSANEQNTELRKLCKAAYHALSSIIAHRDGIPTPTLQDLANKLNAAAGGVEA